MKMIIVEAGCWSGSDECDPPVAVANKHKQKHFHDEYIFDKINLNKFK